MRKYVIDTKQYDRLDEVICNMCGIKVDPEDFIRMNQMDGFEIHFGYGSKHDLKIWKFDICNSCLEKIVDKFIIPIDIEEGII